MIASSSTIRPRVNAVSGTAPVNPVFPSQIARTILFSASDRSDENAIRRVVEWWVEKMAALETLQNTITQNQLVSSDPGKASATMFGVVKVHLNTGLGSLDDAFVQWLHLYLKERASGLSLIELCESLKDGAADRRAVLLEIMQATSCWEEDARDEALLHLVRAAEMAPENLGLRVQVIELCQLTGDLSKRCPVERLPDATQISSGKTSQDAGTIRAMNNVDKAQIALDRLSGLLIDPDSQKMFWAASRRSNSRRSQPVSGEDGQATEQSASSKRLCAGFAISVRQEARSPAKG